MMAVEISLNGTAHKYTNFVFGYQERYFKLQNKSISYYLSKESEKYGCRKFRVLNQFSIELDEEDPHRLDLVFLDERWSLRFATQNERLIWENALKAIILDNEAGTVAPPHSASSPPSSSSSASTCTSQRSRNAVAHVKHDMYSFIQLRHELGDHFHSLMGILDGLTTPATANRVILATTAIDRCRVVGRDLRRLKSALRKPMLEEELSTNHNNSMPSIISSMTISKSGAESETDEWQDAVDAIENTNGTTTTTTNGNGEEISPPTTCSAHMKFPSPLPAQLVESSVWKEMCHVSQEQLHYALAGVDDGLWENFVSDGEMKMYKMDRLIDGIACDPLKAVHTVAGVSAREYIDIFFDPSLKLEWDDTVVKINVVEQPSPCHAVIHQLHRRIWPSNQRESLFWSQKADVSAHKDGDALDAFMVCNHNCEREDVPLLSSSSIRVGLTIAMVCQTVITNEAVTGKNPAELKREDIRCKITYVANVHPGGWVPSTALRQVYKKEYPKFLRKFTKYVEDRVRKTKLNI